MTENPSATIARAFQIVARTAVEWRLLTEALKDELSRRSDYSISYDDEAWAEDPEEWISCAAHIVFAVRALRPGRARVGTLTVLPEFHLAGGPSEALGQAVVMVGWSDWNDPWEYGQLTLPDLPESVGLVEERLFVWEPASLDDAAPAWEDHAWLYIVPLHAFADRADVRRLITNPVFALVEGGDVEKTFQSRPEVLRFAEREGQVHVRA